ncbi:VOC family protein [Pantoea sp. LMR881]|uniref:VOC family protein n=1 Tax=Pantoea sp. LMR881 TaxID=3014336 RepID=UPI0022AEE414|nr:VOC family protein [Pantoea sp. LMR881]MCZ4061533.1 VOC family protein [Pantoea sp. LMR881]
MTRASHVVLNVRDLNASRQFYTELLGLVVSDEDHSAVYLRGLEERGHHSLVLRKSAEATCACIGMRVRNEDDIYKAQDYFAELGKTVTLAEVPYQGLTLHVSDDAGVPLEFCASMAPRERMMKQYQHYRGASAQRLDHYQLQVSDVRQAWGFYQALGFRVSEYTYSTIGNRQHLWGSGCNEKVTRTISSSPRGWGHGCITLPTPCRIPMT